MNKFLTLFVAFALASSAWAGVLDDDIVGSRHVGGGDPVAEGWSIFGPGGPDGPEHGAVDIDGSPFWRLDVTGPGSGPYLQRYNNPGADPGDGDWTMTMRGRVLAVSHPASADCDPELCGASSLKFFGIMPDEDIYGISFNQNLTRVVDGFTSQNGTSSVDPDKTFEVDITQVHTYQTVYDSASATADLYVDGSLAIGDLTRGGGGGPAGMLWGSVTRETPIGSRSDWDLVQMQTGSHIIPEPATLGLLGVCGLMLLRRQRS